MKRRWLLLLVILPFLLTASADGRHHKPQIHGSWYAGCIPASPFNMPDFPECRI